MRQAALGTAGALVERRAPLTELLPRQRVDIGALGQIFERVLVGGHDVGRLHPRYVVEEVVGAEQAGVEVRRGELAVGRQVVGDIDHVHQRVGTLERREGAVQGADHVDLGGAGLRACQNDVQHRAFLSAGDVEATLLENGTELLLLLDGNELCREEDDIAGRRGCFLGGGLGGGGLLGGRFRRCLSRRFGWCFGGGSGLGGRRGRRSRRGAGREDHCHDHQQAENSEHSGHTLVLL